MKTPLGLCFLLISNVCLSQTTTGGLEGKVISNDGKGIEGVSVVVAGLDVLGSIGTVSNANGYFKIPSVPLGTCIVKISHISFAAVQVNAVLIELGIVTNLGTVELQVAQANLPEIVIDNNSPAIPHGAEVQQLLSAEDMNMLPVNRDYKSAITMLPQVNTSYFGDGLNIAGATGGDNMFYVDGINVTDNYNSSFIPGFNNSSYVPFNFIKAVNVRQGGYSAEFGRALGGIVDVVTQSGTNKFRGQMFGYYSGSAFNGSPKGGTTGANLRNFYNYDGGFSIAGPIAKDKLWYFIAYSQRQTVRETEMKGHGFYDDKSTANILAAKFNWKASPKTNVDLALIADPTTTTPVLQYSAGALIPNTITNADVLLAQTKTGGINGILSGRTRVSEHLLFEYAASAYRRRSVFSGLTEKANTDPQYFDHLTGTLAGGIGFNEDFDLDKQGVKLSISQFEELYTRKAGVEIERNAQSGYNSYPAPAIDKWEDDSLTRWAFSQKAELYLYYLAAFYQSEFQLSSRITLELGLRWESQQLLDKDTTLQRFNNQWQPRISLNWFLNNEQTKKISVYAGRVYQALPLNFSLAFSPTFDVLIEHYTNDPREPNAVPVDTVYTARPYETRRFDYDNRDLKSNHADQVSVQYHQTIHKNLRLSGTVLYKTLREVFIYAGDGLKEYFGNPGKCDMNIFPKVKHDYLSFEIAIAGKTRADKLAFGLNYVLSRNFGNIVGFFDQEARNYSPAGTLSFRVPSDRVANMKGLLPNDRTHVVKLNATYQFPFGVTAGAYVAMMSGTPLSKFIPGRFGFPELLEKRGTAGRLPTVWDTNIRSTFKPGKIPLRFSLDVFNLIGLQEVVDEDQFVFLDAGGISPNPSYKKPVRFQSPRAVRLGLEYNF